MIKKLQLTDSQHEGYGRYLDDRATLSNREKRFLQACLVELGGRMNEPWQFDEQSEAFWINIPDEPLKEPNAPTANSGAKNPLGENVAG